MKEFKKRKLDIEKMKDDHLKHIEAHKKAISEKITYEGKIELLKQKGFKKKKDPHGGIYYERIIKLEFFGKFTLEIKPDLKNIWVLLEAKNLGMVEHSVYKFSKLDWLLSNFDKIK